MTAGEFSSAFALVDDKLTLPFIKSIVYNNIFDK